MSVNETGQISASTLVTMARLIKKHVDPLPDLLFWHLKSAIEARTKMHELCVAMAVGNTTPEMEKSNDSHKAFIDFLRQAFATLGGQSWQPSSDALRLSRAVERDSSNILASRFQVLNVGLNGGTTSEGDADSGDADSEADQPGRASIPRRKQARPSRGKRKQKEKKVPAGQTTHCGKDIPLSDYCFLDDDITMENRLAMSWAFSNMFALRMEIQCCWRQVAYSGLNSAIAGAMTNVAVALVRKADGELFASNSEHHSYDAIWRSHASPLEGCEETRLLLDLMSTKGEHAICGLRESCLFYTFEALHDFVVDYRKNRTGKPTRRMQDDLKG